VSDVLIGQEDADRDRRIFERGRAAGLTFAHLNERNVARATRWHPGFPADGWNGADWSNAMCGEAGETANVVKKLRRIETGHGAVSHAGRKHDEDELRAALADELADVVIYADLLAAKYGINLGDAIVAKFNQVSESRGYPERLRAAHSHSEPRP
jgi:NTP pyrophosphatase (non-canonical NTP hydrolase)